jgi:hypothetical protein
MCLLPAFLRDAIAPCLASALVASKFAKRVPEIVSECAGETRNCISDDAGVSLRGDRKASRIQSGDQHRVRIQALRLFLPIQPPR